MNKAATLSDKDAQHKARAEHSLAKAQRVLREMAADRKRSEMRRRERTDIVAEVQAILRSA
jgi:hypothetical protein